MYNNNIYNNVLDKMYQTNMSNNVEEKTEREREETS